MPPHHRFAVMGGKAAGFARLLSRSNRKNQICRHYVPDIFGILLGFVKKTQAFFQLHHASPYTRHCSACRILLSEVGDGLRTFPS